MSRLIGFAGMLGAALLLSASTGQGQEFTVKDGVLTFDKQGFKQEFDKMQRDLRGTRTARAPRAAQTRTASPATMDRSSIAKRSSAAG